ncbi:lysine methyltransferase domain-containing protein [Sarocladium implicatum]|nr:lysine methyltransferase domain-containing protein [Sarocladium implicatum]
MPSLTSRVTLRANTSSAEDKVDDIRDPKSSDKADEVEEQEEEPEDLLFSSLATIFPDDAPNLHGDSHSSIVYTSPYLPCPLRLHLADPSADEERKLFSHYLWNAGLLLAELLESASRPREEKEDGDHNDRKRRRREAFFDVRGLKVLEMGSGTGLPSIMAGLVGAEAVVATDYPSETVLEPLRGNMARNLTSSHAPPGVVIPSSVEVHGHGWGDFTPTSSATTFPLSHKHALDRVLLADCLWMPWQHDALLRSVSYFLSLSPLAKCLCVGACHTGREVVARFFEEERLRSLGLEVEEVWERDVEGKEREWDTAREEEDPGMRKRWCVNVILRRVKGWRGDVTGFE